MNVVIQFFQDVTANRYFEYLYFLSNLNKYCNADFCYAAKSVVLYGCVTFQNSS